MPLILGQCILCLRGLALILAEQFRTHITEVVGTWTRLLHLTCLLQVDHMVNVAIASHEFTL